MTLVASRTFRDRQVDDIGDAQHGLVGIEGQTLHALASQRPDALSSRIPNQTVGILQFKILFGGQPPVAPRSKEAQQVIVARRSENPAVRQGQDRVRAIAGMRVAKHRAALDADGRDGTRTSPSGGDREEDPTIGQFRIGRIPEPWTVLFANRGILGRLPFPEDGLVGGPLYFGIQRDHAVVSLFAGQNHRRLIRQCRQGQTDGCRASTDAEGPSSSGVLWVLGSSRNASRQNHASTVVLGDREVNKGPFGSACALQTPTHPGLPARCGALTEKGIPFSFESMVDSLVFFVLCGLGLLAIVALLGILLWWFMTGRERRRRTLGIVLVLAVSAIGVVILGIFILKPPVKRDLYLSGGYRFTLQISEKPDDEGVPISPDPRAIEQLVDTLRDRLERIGHDDALVQDLGAGRIRVETYGSGIDERDVLKNIVVKPAKLELRLVHSESASKAPLVKEGEIIVPGHVYYEYRYIHDDGEEVYEDLLLSKRVHVEGKHVKFAAPDAQQKGVVNIRLSGEGGDRMIMLTKNMTPRRDRIAVVLDDEIMSAPVVMSVPLGSSFIIEGLDGYEEARDLAASLMNPLEFPVKILEATHVSAVESEAYRANPVSGSVRRFGRTAGVVLGLGVVVLGVIVLGVFALTSRRNPGAAPNLSPPAVPGASPPRDQG